MSDSLAEWLRKTLLHIKLRFSLLLKLRQCWRLFQNLQRNENSWSIREDQCSCCAKGIRAQKVTANGEVQTNEEAQGFVHDLDLFVKVQILDDTPTVLPHGKHCEEPGYSYDWVSGQKPRFTKQRKNIACKTENFLPLVVPGLSSSSGTSASSTSTSQDLSSSSPAAERRDEPAPGNSSETNTRIENLNKERNDNRDSDHRLRDLPEWLEEFTDNQDDTQLLAPAHISQDSDSERLRK